MLAITGHRQLICLLLFIATVVPPALATNEPTREQIDSIFAAVATRTDPGLAVVVRWKGLTVLKKGYGMRDLRSDSPVTTDTNFRLASMSKQFTAMAAMLLIQDGKLHYEDRLTGVFPEFPAYGESITIRDLLDHTSGLRAHEELWAKQYAGRPSEEIPQVTDAEVLHLMEQETSTKFTPGTQWEYSNTGYIILGLIVQKVSGIRFADFLQQRIFAPLGMRNTIAHEDGGKKVFRRAYGYTRVEGKWTETDQSPTSATLGDGGIYSSVDDLVHWDDALSRHSLLSDKEMSPAITPVFLPDPKRLPTGPDGNALAYGFGWRLDPYKGHRVMSHRGGSAGFHTDIERFLDDNLTIIVLCNRTDVEPRDLAHRIADLYFNQNPVETRGSPR
jgi:CubicO group peptidase (beta-lactamase class C family)